MKEHKEKQENVNVTGDNISAEKTNDENKSEISSDESKVSMDSEQSDKTTETETPVDYEAKIAEWKDKYLRLSAEFDNYRKRTLKEKIELTKYANEDFLLKLLPVIDDFEHGLKTIKEATDLEAVKEGIDHIYNKFKDFLAQRGLKEIEITNGEFNTDYHEAISKTPVDDDKKSGKIVDTIQKGYFLDEKVIRHSKVVIGESVTQKADNN